VEIIQIQTTFPEREVAERLATSLVERRLASCVQLLGPLHTTYRWQGAVERADEWLCLIKTTRSGYLGVESAIHEVHPYEVPEIVATDISAGSEAYFSWIDQSVDAD